MTKKSSSKPQVASRKYEVLIPCRKGDNPPYKVGEVIDGKEFSKSVISNWLEIGVLKEVQNDE